MLSLLAQANPLDHVLPHPTGLSLFNIPITNQMAMALVAAVLMLLIFPAIFHKPDDSAPTGARNFFETILEFLRTEVFRPALKDHTDRFVPFLWTLFFFILFCNLLGQIPLTTLFTLMLGEKGEAFGGTATGNISTTAALAICAFFFIHINGVAVVVRSLRDGTYGHHVLHDPHLAPEERAILAPDHQAGHDHPPDHPPVHSHARQGLNLIPALLIAIPLYLWNFAPHPFRPGPGESPLKWVADIPMWLLLVVLEIIGAFIKPFALMMRLFANMIAGHIVLAALVMLIPVGVSLAVQLAVGIPVTILSVLISLLEVFVAFLQAYIFTFLTTLFISSSVAPEH